MRRFLASLAIPLSIAPLVGIGYLYVHHGAAAPALARTSSCRRMPAPEVRSARAMTTASHPNTVPVMFAVAGRPRTGCMSALTKDPPFARRDQEGYVDRFEIGRTTTVTDLPNWLRAGARRGHGATAQGAAAAGPEGVGK